MPKDKRQTLKKFKFQGDSTWQLADISENGGGLRHSEGTVGDHLEDENTGEKWEESFKKKKSEETFKKNQKKFLEKNQKKVLLKNEQKVLGKMRRKFY